MTMLIKIFSVLAVFRTPEPLKAMSVTLLFNTGFSGFIVMGELENPFYMTGNGSTRVRKYDDHSNKLPLNGSEDNGQ